MEPEYKQINFLLVNDPHLTNRWPLSRVDNYLEAIKGKLEWCVEVANYYNAHILFGGDYVDTYNTNPEVINILIKILSKAKKRIFGVVGNHDVYGQNYIVLEKVIVGTLFTSGLITLLDREPQFIQNDYLVVQLTGANYVPNIDKDAKSYYTSKVEGVDKAIHVVHGYLVKKLLPSVGRENYRVISEIITDANIICTGHEHIGYGVEEFSGCTFVNPGSVARINADLREISRTPRVALIGISKCGDTGVISQEIKLLDIPCKPGSEVLSRAKIEENIQRQVTLEHFAKSLGDGPILCDINEMMDRHAKENKVPLEVISTSRKAIEAFEKSQI